MDHDHGRGKIGAGPRSIFSGKKIFQKNVQIVEIPYKTRVRLSSECSIAELLSLRRIHIP